MPAAKDADDLAFNPIHKHVGIIMDKNSYTLSLNNAVSAQFYTFQNIVEIVLFVDTLLGCYCKRNFKSV